MSDFKEGEYIIYVNGDRYQIGKIKRIVDDGAFVWYHSGDTAAKTPFECMHKLENGYCIGETSLGGAIYNKTAQTKENKTNNSAIGDSWEDVKKELFTPEEIVEIETSAALI